MAVLAARSWITVEWFASLRSGAERYRTELAGSEAPPSRAPDFRDTAVLDAAIHDAVEDLNREHGRRIRVTNRKSLLSTVITQTSTRRELKGTAAETLPHGDLFPWRLLGSSIGSANAA